ncbi:MAG: epoxyqueuosine reductase QueH [Bdellovibrionota bacterium]|jgi:predicted adenine nucleotide alpha hydrolase (AANH) superfamily ATPase
MSRKVDYNKLMEEELAVVDDATSRAPIHSKPNLLLHVCCAPCSSACLERLVNHFEVTVFFYNPNIQPEVEYQKRLEEVQRFIQLYSENLKTEIKLIVGTYDRGDFFTATKVKEDLEMQLAPERGERCRRCYQFRMEKTFAYARDNRYDYVATTLTLSPYKDAEKVNQIGEKIAKDSFSIYSLFPTKYLFSDFKKKNGFLRSKQLSKEYNIYQQNYCGCEYGGILSAK